MEEQFVNGMPLSEWLQLSGAEKIAARRENNNRPQHNIARSREEAMMLRDSLPRKGVAPLPDDGSEIPGNADPEIVSEWLQSAAARDEFHGRFADFYSFRLATRAGRVRGYDRAGNQNGPVAEGRSAQLLQRRREAELEDQDAGVDPQLPTDKRARMVFSASPAIRQEFGTEADFVAYRRNLDSLISRVS